MIFRLSKLLVILLLILFLPQSVSAKTIHSKIDNFNITLPDDWIVFPKETLDEIGKEAEILIPGMEWEFKYGFQLDRKGLSIPGRYKNPELNKWTIYPYIFIQTTNKRISEKQLHQMVDSDTFKQATEKIAKKLNKHGDIFAGMSSNQPIYDHKNQIIWWKIVAEKKIQGLKKLKEPEPVIDFLGMVLTNTGFLSVHCYYEPPNERYSIKTCSDIIKSVQSPGNEYKTKPEWEKLFIKILPYFLLKKKR